jgi:predicted ATPase
VGDPVDVPILTPDQRVRVFVSSTLEELAHERQAVRRAVERLQLVPVMFELGARPYPPRRLYRAYLAQSHVFLGIYWQKYGWVAPDEEVSGVEDEYQLCGDLPRLVYVKEPAPHRDSRLKQLLDRIMDDGNASFKIFRSARELNHLVAHDLAILLSERFRAPAPAASVGTAGRRNPLPEVPNSFVGRDRERSALAQLMRRQRLVTVVGPGGVGKTRLAMEAAGQAAGRFRGRVSVVELATVAPDRAGVEVPQSVVRALNLLEDSAQGRRADHTALVTQALRGAPTLLVLDNCEHVLEAVAVLVGRIVAECPSAHVLATGREALEVAGERLVPVAPLSADAAVQLFADRAATLRPGFALTARNRPTIQEICRRLDGLPLAIELAAAWITTLPPEEIARRLDDRFRLLGTARGHAQPRHQSLRAMVDWSYSLLSDRERRVFARLSVFAGGIPLDGAEEVCAAGDVNPLDVLDLVARLVGKSLVVSDYDDEGSPRFRMLETLRQYAQGRLDDSGTTEDARIHHATFVADLAESAWLGMRGPDQESWFGRLDREHDNIRGALDWAVRHDASIAQRIAGNLGWFWWLRSDWVEGERWLHGALGAPGSSSPALTARTRAMHALLLQDKGQIASATEAARQALADALEAGGEPLWLARLILAAVVGRAGDLHQAFDLLQAAEAGGDRWVNAVSDLIRAQLLSTTDREAMRAAANRAISAFTSLGDRWGELNPRLQLALDSQQHGDAATAVEHYGRCLQIARELALPSYETVFVILASASADLQPQRYAAGQVIVRQGDEADAFYIITDGQLDVLVDQPDDPPLPVNRLRRGEYFGEIALLRGGRRTATVRVSTDAPAEALALDRATFDRLLAESETARNDVERVLSVRGVGPLSPSNPPASGSADVDFPYASTSESTRSRDS